ncbi:leucine-rich repeat-containing protein kinase family protein [Pedobacter frigidisoli]|uniref:leucine-rich repeat-containing protein kinase family protein n=1 Tax=Pedobacter frigidisoli TaxID=2530455 RepID=UPI001CED3A80|nr:protein kinase [Pedobacter frigidisoli]
MTNNKLLKLPAEIGSCVKMQKLMLAGNRLRDLPKELQLCEHLSLLRISANELQYLPEWLLTMNRLAWLAFSGNDFNRNPIIKNIPVINLDELQFSDKLGEGASGIIYKASRIVDQVNVAVKIFKGDVTSDGYPEDEMNAYIQAGGHFGLVNLLGQIDAPEQGKRGLVMALIPSSFYNLGRPPSLASCTRDVFGDDILLSSKLLYKIALTIASVAEQLRSRGIIHGDLYAHNILIDNEGNTLFGDFGAASLYDLEDDAQTLQLEKIEVRAYGFLLDDLLSICQDSEDLLFRKEIMKLRDNCLSLDFSDRPSFNEIVMQLSHITLFPNINS